MKLLVGLLLTLTIAVAGVFWFGNGWGKDEVSVLTPAFKKQNGLPLDIPPQTGDTADYRHFINLLARSAFESSMENIQKDWHPGSTVMLLEMATVIKNPVSLGEIFDVMREKTGQEIPDDRNTWFPWIWNQAYEPHPQYAEFKGELYSRVDERFAEYFVATGDAKIRLDEIRWGGVIRDGIPPLKTPSMISADQATYLADTDVVFGIEINDDVRCYPKRILAWHEMFKDVIGGQSVCGVY